MTQFKSQFSIKKKKKPKLCNLNVSETVESESCFLCKKKLSNCEICY